MEPEEDPLDSVHWYEALELGERPRAEAPCHDGVLAARRLERWRTQAPFADDAIWRRYLDQAGIDSEDAFKALLGEKANVLAARAARPAWLDEIEVAYGAPVSPPFDWPETAEPTRIPLLCLAEPLIHRAYERLAAAGRSLASTLPGAPFDESVARILASHLPELLAPMLNRVMVVELNVARLEEKLQGETPQERFANFIGGLRRREEALDILGRYPVLARHLVQRLDQWQNAGAEFLRHLAEDAGEIREKLNGGRDLGRLVQAGGAVSDPHRGGRGVFLLRFDSGCRLVYKPRPLGVEQTFQDLLGWVNARGFEPALYVLRVLDRDDHGWVEFVPGRPCQDPDGVRRFYERQGGYLGLIYLLDGSDFHHENLIASGEHPVLVDLETLFQPWVLRPSLDDAEHRAGAPLAFTVLRANLLPEPWWGDGDDAGVDLSGLGSRAGQLTPKPVLAMADHNTDQMRVERRRLEIPEGENRPRLDGHEIAILDHREDLERGFVRMYELFLRHRDALLAPGGPLEAFAGAEVRVLFRTTATYGHLQLESFHPHLLGNALERRRLLDRLWNGVPERPYLERVIPFEIHDLERMDVPFFTTLPDSRHVWTSRGKRLADVFSESGLERVRGQIAAFGPEDLERQRGIIRDTFRILELAGSEPWRPSYDFRESPSPASRNDLLAAARKVGERLLASCFQDADEAHWLVIDYREPQGWRVVPAGPDVYQGLPGIALFLGYLGALTGDGAFTAVARKATLAMRHQLAGAPGLLEGIGLWSGWGGVIYSLTHLGVLWQDEELLSEAESLCDHIEPLIAEDEYLDVLAGGAGCIVALLGLARHRPSARVLALARACGERLLAKAEEQERGLGWVMPIAGDKPLAGMSHGAAGIALALLQLADATAEERFRDVALAGLEYERGLFDEDEGNWPDLRAGRGEGFEAGGGTFMCAWCHGAAGIGLARLASLGALEDCPPRGIKGGRHGPEQAETARREIATAMASTLDKGFGENHCLCHGDLGNLDFLLEVARAFGDGDLLERVYHHAGGILQSIEEHGRLFGLQGSTETPGLMVGLAGIGYGLARLADPDRLPSLLSLAPPPG